MLPVTIAQPMPEPSPTTPTGPVAPTIEIELAGAIVRVSGATAFPAERALGEEPCVIGAGKGADAVILCVTGTPEVEQIVNGDDGLLAHAKPGLLVIDCSTAEPASAAQIRAAFAARGVAYVDAPLARTPQHAEAAARSIE